MEYKTNVNLETLNFKKKNNENIKQNRKNAHKPLNFRGVVMTPSRTFILTNLHLKLYNSAKLIHRLVYRNFLNKEKLVSH